MHEFLESPKAPTVVLASSDLVGLALYPGNNRPMVMPDEIVIQAACSFPGSLIKYGRPGPAVVLEPDTVCSPTTISPQGQPRETARSNSPHH